MKFSNIEMERAALAHLGVGLSQSGMKTDALRELGERVLAGKIVPATKTGGFEEMSDTKPYESRKLFASTGKGSNQPADRRLAAAVNHLTEKHGDGAESRIRSMSGASLILLGERILLEKSGKTNSASGDQGAPYVARQLFGG